MRRIADDRDRGAPVEVELEGRPVRAYDSETLAVALYASDVRVLTRSLKYHRPRAFFCLEGHCGGCLMRIDGVPNLRACMEPARAGRQLEAQNAYPSAEIDVLELVDFAFPKGMDHHTLMTGSRLLNRLANKVVRQLSGLGTLPDAPAAEFPAVRRRTPDVAVIGAGPAGLAAAEAAARAGAQTILIDEHPRLGGSLLAHPEHGPRAAAAREAAVRGAGVEVFTSATAAAYYPEDDGGVLAVATPDGLVRVQARRTVYATGGYAVNALFANNDRPGVLAARAVGRLLVTYGVKPAHRVVVVGADAYARALTDALAAAGCEVTALPAIDRARGRNWVTGVDAGKKKIPCELIAVSTTPAPASETPRQHGCEVVLDPAAGGYRVIVDVDGRTTVAEAFACGDVCGYVGPQRAAEAGARIGRVAAEEARA